jgi:glutaredoxin
MIVPIIITLVMFLLFGPLVYKQFIKCVSVGNNNNGNRFVVYGYMKCPYTVKMLEELKFTNQSYDFIDVNTQSGNTKFEKILSGRTGVGVPYTIDKQTGEHMLGYKKINI